MIQSIERELKQFRESFHLRNCNVYDFFIVYRVPRGLAFPASEDANKLIDKLKLNLVAVPTTLQAGDSFTVKSSDYEL